MPTHQTDTASSDSRASGQNTRIPERASAVIIGGGVTGASVAYHLAKLGWQDVVLLERRQFACGTTWHAAGLIGTMRANESHARLCEYSMRLLHELEEETGQSTGFRQVGSLSIAHSEDTVSYTHLTLPTTPYV